MALPAEIRDVSDTAVWVAYYRGRESERADALFRDPLAKLLAADRGERIARSFGRIGPSVEWAVVTRTVILDEYILREIADGGVDAVVNIGAGLDTRPYRMKLPPGLQWVEADLPQMVEYKNRTLHAHVPHCRLQRVAVDLSDGMARRKFLAGVVPEAGRVLVLTEGVVPYLTEEQVADLAADLLSHPRFALWLAEYFSPKTYMYLKFKPAVSVLANAPLRFFPDDWTGFFLNHGWERKEIRYNSEVARRTGRIAPMKAGARLLISFMSEEAKDRARTLTGFMLMAPRRH